MGLLASDYDGTLYTNERNMIINCKMLSTYLNNGNYFVLSSGRSQESLLGEVNKYNIPYSYLSCCDGSFLFENNRLIYADPVSHDAVKIFDKLKRLKIDSRLEFAYPEHYATEYEKYNYIGSIALTLKKKDVDNKFIEIFEKIKMEHPEYQYDIYGYNDEVYYLVRPHGVSKAGPIKFLQEELDLSKKDIYTIGDNTNDKELIRDYNGYRIGDNPDIIDVALRKYDAVHQLIKDINDNKAIKRW